MIDLNRVLPSALRDALQTRDALRDARRQYHLSLVIADERGFDAEDIAAVLDTKPSYVQNAIRRHKEGTCGCGVGYPGDEA